MYCREAPRQQLTNHGNNEDVLAHPCHEYVLDQLQCGVSPDALVEALLQEYLVKTTRSQLVAYRKFEESRGPYWTLELLELQHWENSMIWYPSARTARVSACDLSIRGCVVSVRDSASMQTRPRRMSPCGYWPRSTPSTVTKLRCHRSILAPRC